MGTDRERRETIGRGLRLCVQADGTRVRGFDTNTLTVIATESYEQFAENLQKEIEADTGIRFGIVEDHQFAGIAEPDGTGRHKPLGFERSKELHTFLKGQGYIDARGKVQDELRKALKSNQLVLPAAFQHLASAIGDVLRKLAGRLEIKNADERERIGTNKKVLLSDDFRALWDRIKHKTTYRVQFDNAKLVADAAQALAAALERSPVTGTRAHFRTADLEINKGGVAAVEKEVSSPVALAEADVELPDILTELQDKTQLTRKSIARILTDSGKLADFARNPQQFIALAAATINDTKRRALVDGIRYERKGTDHYESKLFDSEELMGYLKSAVPAQKAVYDHVVCDSDVERRFAEDCEKNTAVKVYAKAALLMST
ncbi:MAG: hypothetical protein FJ304_17790 [Planctomycetes bacterium]|nr:hypothetical protein [Planctomycetota bacterium]